MSLWSKLAIAPNSTTTSLILFSTFSLWSVLSLLALFVIGCEYFLDIIPSVCYSVLLICRTFPRSGSHKHKLSLFEFISLFFALLLDFPKSFFAIDFLFFCTACCGSSVDERKKVFPPLLPFRTAKNTQKRNQKNKTDRKTRLESSRNLTFPSNFSRFGAFLFFTFLLFFFFSSLCLLFSCLYFNLKLSLSCEKMCTTPSEWNFQLFNDRSDNFEWSEKYREVRVLSMSAKHCSITTLNYRHSALRVCWLNVFFLPFHGFSEPLNVRGWIFLRCDSRVEWAAKENQQMRRSRTVTMENPSKRFVENQLTHTASHHAHLDASCLCKDTKNIAHSERMYSKKIFLDDFSFLHFLIHRRCNANDRIEKKQKPASNRNRAWLPRRASLDLNENFLARLSICLHFHHETVWRRSLMKKRKKKSSAAVKRREKNAEKLRNVGIKWKLFFHKKKDNNSAQAPSTAT